jgi:hypothetical protein
MNLLCRGDVSQTSVADLVSSAFDKSKSEKSSSEFKWWINAWLKKRAARSAPTNKEVDATLAVY